MCTTRMLSFTVTYNSDKCMGQGYGKRSVALTDCVCVHACMHVWVHDICVNVQTVEIFVLLSNII